MPLDDPDPPLEDEVVRLRPPGQPDADWIAEACDDPEIRRWIPHMPSPYERSHAVAHIARATRRWASGEGAMFVIDERKAARGLIELSIRADGHGSIGYWIAPAARGRGLATRALRLVTEWALGTLELARISLTTDPDNVRSQRVAEKAGYEREGLLRAWQPTPYGRRDSVMYARVATRPR
jgi:RimJ/RimL family protein N-acetyltransferase